MPTQRSPVIPYAYRAAMIIAKLQARHAELGPESGAATASFIAQAMYATDGWAIPTTHRVVRQMKKEGLLRETTPTPYERITGGRPLIVTTAGRAHAKRHLRTSPPTDTGTPSDPAGTTR